MYKIHVKEDSAIAGSSMHELCSILWFSRYISIPVALGLIVEIDKNLCNWNDHIINDLVQMPITWRRLCRGKGQVGSARAISTLESPPTIPDLAPIRWQNCDFRVVFCSRASFGTFCYLLIWIEDFPSREDTVATKDYILPISKNAISLFHSCHTCLASCPTDSITTNSRTAVINKCRVR